MKRLIYIVAAVILAITAIVAKTSALNVSDKVSDSVVVDSTGVLLTVDTIVSDSVWEATKDSLQNTYDLTPRHPGRNRRVTAVNNASTRTQYVNDAQGDTARMLERRRQRSIHLHDSNGHAVMVDTVTGQEWVDSTLMPPPPRMKFPLIYAVEVGANVWDPVMRAFGQKHGIMDFSGTLNLHNRYLPTFELGLGTAKNTPAGMNFTYSSPVAPYFKIGADYNFLYNSDPDYRFVGGLRYGFSAFRYKVSNVRFDDSYWDEDVSIRFPSQSVVAGWLEFVVGLRVKIYGPISAGWMLRYHTILHQSHPKSGNAWYIPGYGSSTSSITGSFSVFYTFELPQKNRPEPSEIPNEK